MKPTHPFAVGLTAILAVTAGSANAGIDFFTLQLPSTPGGHVAASPVSDFYWKDSKIQLKAVPDAGYRFLGWTSGVASSKNPDSVVMNAHRTVAAKFVDTAELVPYGGFEFGYTKWEQFTNTSTPANYSLKNGMACIKPIYSTTRSHNVRLLYDLPRISKGDRYQLSIKMKSSSTHRVDFLLRNKMAPWNNKSAISQLTATRTIATFHQELIANDSSALPRLAIYLGLDSSEICLDDISLRRATAPIVQLGNFAFRSAGLLARDGNIRVRTEGPGTWTLKSLDGRTLSQGPVHTSGVLEIADVPAGIGFLTIQTPHSRETYRFTNF